MEEAKVCVLCTSHMTEEDGHRLELIWLDGWQKEIPRTIEPCRGAFEEGGWFYTGSTAKVAWPAHWSDALRLVLQACKNRGYAYVLFDRDAEVDRTLSTFDW